MTVRGRGGSFDVVPMAFDPAAGRRYEAELMGYDEYRSSYESTFAAGSQTCEKSETHGVDYGTPFH